LLLSPERKVGDAYDLALKQKTKIGGELVHQSFDLRGEIP
jgi:hypothetical protein